MIHGDFLSNGGYVKIMGQESLGWVIVKNIYNYNRDIYNNITRMWNNIDNNFK